jgi:hypothetical protein
MHSDESDIVLDWRHIARWSRTLAAGSRCSLSRAAGTTSCSRARRSREEVFSLLFSWPELALVTPV